MKKLYIFTHTDLDGVGAASLYLAAMKKIYEKEVDSTIVFVEPYNLHISLKKTLPKNLEASRIAILDLGANPKTISEIALHLEKIVHRNNNVEWADHHVWNKEWRDFVEQAGVKLYINTSTCATGVVYAVYSEYLGTTYRYIANNVCSADLWRWDEWLSTMLYRIAGRYSGPRGDAWRRMLIKEFSEERFWNDYFQELVENYVDLELRGYRDGVSSSVVEEYDGRRLVYLVKRPGPPNNSLMASYLLSKKKADIAIIVRDDASISLRSRSYNVRDVAVCLGGGGHPRASGANIKLSLYLRLIKTLLPSIYYRILLNKTRKALKNCL